MTETKCDVVGGGGRRLHNASAEAGLMGLASFATDAVAGWGRDHARAMRETWGHALSVAAIGESLPNPTGRVDLDPEAHNSFGIPLARITSWLSESDITRLRFMPAKCRELLAACGAAEIIEASTTWDGFNSTHVFGTCRMGTPATSVVDPDLRSQRWRNLWITDASVCHLPAAASRPLSRSKRWLYARPRGSALADRIRVGERCAQPRSKRAE